MTAALLCLLALLPRPARSDDGMFRAAPSARKFIDFDGKGFLIRGKRTFIVSGSLHYSRVPLALWRDRLLRMKRAGFNTVQTYAFWNYSEPRPGVYDWHGNHNLDAFLKLVKSLGMYATVRVGPYVCAEWDSGGYPVWLRFVKGVRVREDNKPFEAAVADWYDHVIPIVARNQINHGGAVIMVQLENEHPLGWGRDMPNGYFRFLRDQALALGLQVPYFFSGLHHGDDPAGDHPWSSAERRNPWYTTEFWPGWYNYYGPLSPALLRKFDRGTWKIIAYGGNGYNYYMLHGGANFAHWNNNEVAASYDYSAAIGQAGDLRPIYYRFKRAALFARSFRSVLEQSDDATERYQGVVSSAVRETARSSPAGDLLFLDNPAAQIARAELSLPSFPRASIRVEPGEIRPVVVGYHLLPGLTLALATVRVCQILSQGSTTTLVVGGSPGAGELRFALSRRSGPSEVSLSAPPGAASVGPAGLVLRAPAALSSAAPTEYSFRWRGRLVRVLWMTRALSDRVWRVGHGGQTALIVGPAYVGAASNQSGHLRVEAEEELGSPAPLSVLVYTSDLRAVAMHPLTVRSVPRRRAPALTPWLAAEATPSRHTQWQQSSAPRQMGSDGDDGAYAWYRTVLTAPAAGDYTLRLPYVGDWVQPFADGKPIRPASFAALGLRPGPRSFNLRLKAGDTPLLLLTGQYGRDKLVGYLGPIHDMDRKGITGPVTLERAIAPDVDITHWQWRAASGRDDLAGSGDWSPVETGADVFRGRVGFALFRVDLPQAPGPERTMHFEDVDDNCAVYLNGARLAAHDGWGQPFDVPLGAAWRDAGPNTLEVMVENNAGPGGITGPVTLSSEDLASRQVVESWRMRGAVDNPPVSGWLPWQNVARPGFPVFYRSQFRAGRPGAAGVLYILRLDVSKLSAGFVWLNGHNLGRFPERIPAPGIYLPECWIHPGLNSLDVFDQSGNPPKDLALHVEAAASRRIRTYEAVLALPAVAEAQGSKRRLTGTLRAGLVRGSRPSRY